VAAAARPPNLHNPLVHPAVRKIAEAWRGTPFEGKAFLVGGAVRDELLGRDVKNDLDIVLEADALAAVRILKEKGVSEIEPVTYARFGTAMVRVDGANVEFVTARKESYSEESRKPDVEPATILEDAQRRDFTVNTLLRDIWTSELSDPLGNGLSDLESKVLRTPLDPEATFRDDPLRMLRAVRFRWQLGFSYAPDLANAVRDQASRLKVVSAERIRDEFVKMLALPDAERALQDLLELNLLVEFAPEFVDMVGCEQGGYHHLDVWSHTLLALKNAGPNDLVLSLATLLHDVGKPLTKTVETDGRTRFFGHENVGESIARTILRRLRFGNDVEDRVALLVKNHMRLNSMSEVSPSAARRIVRDLGPDLDRWLRLIEADAGALKPGVRELDLGPVRTMIEEVSRHTPPEALESPLSGERIMEITGLEPGPKIGRLKAALAEDVIEGRLSTGDEAEAKVRLMEHLRNAED